MANQIPLNTTTDAAGGFLVPEILGDILTEKVQRLAPTLGLSSVRRVGSNRASYPVYKGRPTAEFVSEGADKPITGAEFGELTVNVKKLATFVVYTEEMIEDARIDPEALVNDDVEQAFSDLVDKHLLGIHAGDTSAFYSTDFDDATDATQKALQNTAMTVELGTGPDAYALAVSEAMEKVEMNGYMPNGIVSAFAAKRALRDARDADGRPLYREGFSGNVPSVEGLNLAFTTNLAPNMTAGLVGGAGSPGKTIAVVGDFAGCSKAVMRKDLGMKRFDQAVIGTHNLARQNKIAVRWEMRMGYTIFDRDRAFVRIINAA